MTSTPTAGRLLDAGTTSSVRSLSAASAAADGHPPVSEQVLLHLGEDRPGRLHLLVHDGPAVIGYAHLEAGTAELVVAPDRRREGVGRRLLAELLRRAPGVQVWSHGGLPAGTHLAEALGMTRGRVLHQLRRPLDAPLDPVALPAGVTVRTFIVGADEAAWTALNALAFAHHAEQGGWDIDEVLAREHEAWFDPAGFFLAERGDRLVGFHWTKVHDEQPPVGEVYVVGVDPSEQGTGLGSALTLTGLHHLRDRGLAEVLLYVDDDNPRAVRVYTRLGFTVASTDVQWVDGGSRQHDTSRQ